MNLTRLQTELHEEIKLFNPDEKLEQAWTPPASWYTDPQFLKLESATVFRQHWLYAGRVDQVSEPGSYFTGTVAQVPFIVARDEDNQLNAFCNVCLHHGTRVADGNGCAEFFTCPYHGWQYALTGKLIKAPKAGAHALLKGGYARLKPLAVAAFGPWIFIALNRDADPSLIAPFFTQLEPAAIDQPQFIKQISYELDCNWKVFVDNYLDGGYHVPHMHPDLGRQLDLGAYRSEVFDNFVLQTCPSKAESPEEANRIGAHAVYAWLYPNFIVNRYGRWMDTNLVLPMGEDRCQVIFDYYHDGPLEETALENALAASDQVQKEDMTVCQMVRDGLRSGVYEQGVYAPRFEAPMFHFHRMLHADFTR